jgi:hypothetical protein
LLRRVFFHFHESDRVAHLLCGNMYNNSTFLGGSTLVFFLETDRVKLNHVRGLNVYISHFLCSDSGALLFFSHQKSI